MLVRKNALIATTNETISVFPPNLFECRLIKRPVSQPARGMRTNAYNSQLLSRYPLFNSAQQAQQSAAVMPSEISAPGMSGASCEPMKP